MKIQRVLLALAALTLFIGLAACGKGEGKKESSNLDQALRMAPADTGWFYFTDWALIKEYEGYTDISSQDSLDRRMKFLMFGADVQAGTPMRQAMASAYGIQYLRNHAEVWGWDSTDLAWEITLESEGSPPLYVLKFADDFDFGPFLALLQEREFTSSEYQGVTIYSHEQDIQAEWLRSTAAFALLNTAVIEKERRLVLSSSVDSVYAVLDVFAGDAQSLADDENAQAIAGRLGEVAAAVIAAGPDTCTSFGVEVFLLSHLTAENRERLLEKLREEYGLDKPLTDQDRIHPYIALGVGYRYEGEKPVGLLVFHYASETVAQTDMERRRKLADEGTSMTTRQPIRETLFTVDEANVEGSDLVWRVSPVNGIPRRLFDMVWRRDMLFAVCP
jgi:hypothetical protein